MEVSESTTILSLVKNALQRITHDSKDWQKQMSPRQYRESFGSLVIQLQRGVGTTSAACWLLYEYPSSLIIVKSGQRKELIRDRLAFMGFRQDNETFEKLTRRVVIIRDEPHLLSIGPDEKRSLVIVDGWSGLSFMEKEGVVAYFGEPPTKLLVKLA